VLGAGKCGIAKINVGTEIRQSYEAALKESGSQIKAQEAVYHRTVELLRDYLHLTGIRAKLM
jgi:fructose/tagatose bisphosphate aldolase